MAKKKLKWGTHADLAINIQRSVLREEFLDHMTFKANIRPLFSELFGPIIGLKEEWFEQGATPEELDFSTFSFRCEQRFHVPVGTGRVADREPEVIEDSDEYLVTRDDIGRVMKLPKGSATIALPLNFPVKSMDDWLKIKPKYEFTEARFGAGW